MNISKALSELWQIIYEMQIQRGFGRSVYPMIFSPEQFYGKFILICLVVNMLHHLDKPAIEIVHHSSMVCQ